MGDHFLAIDIGGTTFSVALVDGRGTIAKKRGGSTDRSGGAAWMLKKVIGAAHKIIGQIDVRACGVGFGGPVDFAAQRVLSSTHVLGWEDMPLAEIVESELALPTIIENDANAGALGEFVFGAGRACSHLVYYTISTGIGGGIVVDGQIYRGANGNAGELGHIAVAQDGPLCDCGNRGCLEALCSAKSISRRAGELVQKHPRRGRFLRELARGGDIDAKVVFDGARSNDALACEIVEQTCTYLGMGLAGAMNAFAPDRIVIGGGVSKAGRVLYEPLRRQTARFTMPVHRPHLHIVQARRGDHTVLLGAAALARTLHGGKL